MSRLNTEEFNGLGRLGYPGRLDGRRKNYWEEFPGNLKGNTVVFVTEAEDLLGELDSSKVYVIDGVIDTKDYEYIVPEGGLTLEGYGFEPSQLVSTADDITMFKNADGSFSGNIFFTGLSLEASGTGSKLFDVDNDDNSSAIEFNDVNFNNTTELGDIRNYRQMLFRNTAFLTQAPFSGSSQGFTLHGSMTGVAILDSIMLLFTAPSGYTLFREGTSLTMSGSFRSNLNALEVPADWTFFDFPPSVILADEGVLLDGVRTTAADPVPNIPGSNLKAYYKNCRGFRNTYVGSQYEVTASALTSIGAADTLYKLEGTTTYSDEQHFNSTVDNAITYASEVEREFKVVGIISVTGSNNREIALQLRQWDNSASAYMNIGPEYVATLNGGPAGTRGENIALQGFVILDEDDRIEVWVKNKSDDTDVTVSVGGSVEIEER